MATLNKKARNTKRTHEGAMAAHMNAEQKLRRSVLACLLWEKQFYEEGQDIADRIVNLAHKVDFDTVCNLAIEARTQHRLRHAPLLLLTALVSHPRKSTYAHVIKQVIQRADEITELVSMYWRDGKKPLPAQMKKGLALAFLKFDEYQFAKYNRNTEVKLRDVMFMVHPKPQDGVQAKLFTAIADDKLQTPDTWEVSLSTGADKGETFTRLLEAKKLGYMALLRNLRNMHEAGVDRDLIHDALIWGAKRSKALPFRYIAAAHAVPAFETSLDKAMQAATAELPRLEGKTLLLLDHSGSMDSRLSNKSDLMRYDAAAGLAVLLAGVCDELEAHSFSSDPSMYYRDTYKDRFWLTQELPHRQGMAMADAYKSSMPMWGGTMLGAALKKLDKGDYDRMIVITDEQSADRVPNPKGRGYMINIASYKNGVGYKPWIHIDGFSESIVNWIQNFENLS